MCDATILSKHTRLPRLNKTADFAAAQEKNGKGACDHDQTPLSTLIAIESAREYSKSAKARVSALKDREIDEPLRRER